MREHKQSRIILSLLLGLILLACLPVCAFADTSELSDGDEAGISLSTTVPPSVVSGGGAAYTKGGASGLTFTTDDTKDNLLRVLVDGKVVSTENYTVSGNPLAITLHPDFMDTLSAGEHTIEIVTTNGRAFARFAIASEFTYTMISGENGSWTKGSGVPYTITVKRDFNDSECFSHFTGVEIDGVVLASSDYAAKAGSTIVTFKAATLQKLSVGDHTVAILFDDGSVSTRLTIKAAPSSPATGDNSNMELWIALMCLSAAGLASLIVYGSKRKARS